MKKSKKLLVSIFLIALILVAMVATTKLMLQIFDTTVYADVGSFEDYSSGSDWRIFMG